MNVQIPPIKTQGKKTKIVETIAQNLELNPDGIWYEPFLGSGVVGFNLAPYNAVFSDTNPYIIGFYNELNRGGLKHNSVREYLEENGNKLSEQGESYYYEVRDRFNEKHDLLDFLFLNRSCFNGLIRFNRDYKFNVPFCKKTDRFSKSYITKIVNQVKWCEEKFKYNDWKFVCDSFENMIPQADENDFIYCDPPYIGRNVDYYDSWSKANEWQLNCLLKDTKAKFILSTWDSNSSRKNPYIETYWSWCYEVKKKHRYQVGPKSENRNDVTEALLMNYEHDR